MPGQMRRHRRLALPVLAAVLAACSASEGGVTQSTSSGNQAEGETAAATSEPSTGDSLSPSDTVGAQGGATRPESMPPFDAAPIEWEPLNDAVDVGTVEVPIDYAEPDGPRFELFVARYRALDQDRKIGSLLVNPGGPGFGGSDWAIFAAQVFDRPLLERFDIIGWDPRGAGQSDPAIDCIDDYDPYFALDGTPDDEAEYEARVEAAEGLARQCVAKNAAIIQHVGTNNSARDIDSIRRALAEETISYFGFSYGSELGATWATLFPDTVRAAVLDGASDPTADPLESEQQQLRGFEGALATFLGRCSSDPECEFHHDGDAEGAFDALMAELDAKPIPGGADRPAVNRDIAITAVAQAMYSESYWPALERSLAAAERGDGSGLLALYDDYYQRRADGTYGNELEAFQAISCADDPERPAVEEADGRAADLTEVAPRLAPVGSAGSYFCTFFPPSLDPRVEITGAGAGTIVVIGTTGDAATPLESTKRMADALADGRLVVVEADQHTGYGVNRCVIDLVNDYLVDLQPPADGTECG